MAELLDEASELSLQSQVDGYIAKVGAA